MSMSIGVYGLKPVNDKWKKMKAIYDACKSAGVKTPKEVDEYFDDNIPDENGIAVSIKYSQWGDADRAGIEINIDELPKDVKIIRFYNSW